MTHLLRSCGVSSSHNQAMADEAPVDYNLAGVRKSTIMRSRQTHKKIQEAHRRVVASCAAAAPAAVVLPDHLLAAFK